MTLMTVVRLAGMTVAEKANARVAVLSTLSAYVAQ